MLNDQNIPVSEVRLLVGFFFTNKDEILFKLTWSGK
jgi:hypothetical protein